MSETSWPVTCCSRCDDENPHYDLLVTSGLQLRRLFFIVCKTCGNKRCPKATDHRLECTGSNEPGQPGSRYA